MEKGENQDKIMCFKPRYLGVFFIYELEKQQLLMQSSKITDFVLWFYFLILLERKKNGFVLTNDITFQLLKYLSLVEC